ncbi:MAG TPA: uroporphyrinogen decarboxylase family protein [Armatimonadota bacterium]|nr:uroporphyrinogen decarboxylase family protein [Armatimonadota bacterium]
MTPKERLIAAFELREPDDIVPTFELQFQLAEELLGKKHVSQEALDQATPQERDRLLKQNAELYIEEAETLDFSEISLSMGPHKFEDQVETIKLLKRLSGDKFMITAHVDGTMSIPNGANMMEQAIRLSEESEAVHAELKKSADGAVEHSKKLVDVGVDCFNMCADYCFNDGPFLSPRMFREFVTPYLAQVIAGMREMGAYAVKHTDGDIMPILDQLVECRPHALHSIDPQAGVDLKEVKTLVGDKVCLCGNVSCAILQTGTVEDVVKDSERALRDGMPGGGFVFCTSNTPFVGMPLVNYLAMLEVRKRLGRYKNTEAQKPTESTEGI